MAYFFLLFVYICSAVSIWFLIIFMYYFFLRWGRFFHTCNTEGSSECITLHQPPFFDQMLNIIDWVAILPIDNWKKYIYTCCWFIHVIKTRLKWRNKKICTTGKMFCLTKFLTNIFLYIFFLSRYWFSSSQKYV